MKFKYILFLFTFYSISSAQKVLITTVDCGFSNKEKTLTEVMAEYQIKFYKRIFDFEPQPVSVHLIGKHKEYQKLEGHVFAKYPTAGFYTHVEKCVYVDKTRSSYLKTIYHEMNHALVDQVMKKMPTWLNEGMSELFANFEVTNSTVTPDIDGYKLIKLKSYIDNGGFDLAEFLTLNQQDWQSRNAVEEGFSYAVSYSFVCFLVIKYPNSLEMIVTQLRNGLKSIEAIEYATKKEFKTIEKEFKTQTW